MGLHIVNGDDDTYFTHVKSRLLFPLLQPLPKHRRADSLGSREVDDFAVFFEVIAFAGPVGAEDEGVDCVFLDVFDLLAGVALGDDEVGVAGGLNGGDALLEGVVDVGLAALEVPFGGGDSYDEIVAERLGAAEYVEVTFMQKVEGAVCDDFFHSCDGALSHLSSRKNVKVPLERLGVGVVLVVAEEEVAEDLVESGEFFYAVTPRPGLSETAVVESACLDVARLIVCGGVVVVYIFADWGGVYSEDAFCQVSVVGSD